MHYTLQVHLEDRGSMETDLGKSVRFFHLAAVDSGCLRMEERLGCSSDFHPLLDGGEEGIYLEGCSSPRMPLQQPLLLLGKGDGSLFQFYFRCTLCPKQPLGFVGN